MNLPHLDGHSVEITREKITWPGARLRKKDEGMPSFDDINRKGTLYVTFDVAFPKGELSADEKDAVRRIFDQHAQPPKVYNGLQGY